MDLTTIFYREFVGNYPFKNDQAEAITRCTIAWLTESGISKKEILKILSRFSKKAIITPNDIPDSLWENSLIKKGEYYCHHELQLHSPTTIYKMDGSCISFPFYQEIKIRYMMNDLLDYFYRKLTTYSMLRNPKRDTSQMKHVLDEFGAIKKVQPLDILLFLIDNMAYENTAAIQPFDLTRSSKMVNEAIDKVIRVKNERHAKGYDRIVWRNYLVEGNTITWMIKK